MSARSIKVRGVVQGVGFRPFVYRLAQANTLAGWVFNDHDGVEIFVEGGEDSVQAFIEELRAHAPAAARIDQVEIHDRHPAGLRDFTIRESASGDRATTGISPDLAICDDCLRELFTSDDPRYRYPYINCTNCGPRYSVTERLPYDRKNTTMKAWPLDERCARQYHDPADRRFHAQPVACSACGPGYVLSHGGGTIEDSDGAIRKAAALLREGKIIALKGIGGYHLACDATKVGTVRALRKRKFRKAKPFAVMVPDVASARRIAVLDADAESLLSSPARPIVLARARVRLPGVAPSTTELGVMLPYTPVHHLLFDAGAPEILVLTSANRSSEPIAYEDDDAIEKLSAIADGFLIGERPISRRVEDSVVRSGAFGPVILRRSRGYAPAAVATMPTRRPILALGADLKNTVTLVINGQAFVSQHIGDLGDYDCFRAFQESIDDLLALYGIRGGNANDLLIVHDSHPQYISTQYARQLARGEIRAVQHHRAHVASVLAERGAWSKRVIGVSFDGTGFGDDGTIWGGEIFAGSVAEGFDRIAHLRPAVLAGGDASAHYPVQAAAGFLAQLGGAWNVLDEPFRFPQRYRMAHTLLGKNVRTFMTTSVGRLFDAAAALCGFTEEISYEGQAAMWLEQAARTLDPGTRERAYPVPFTAAELDFRPLLQGVGNDRLEGRPIPEIARAFHQGLANGLAVAITQLCSAHETDTAVLSGGVFQNELLCEDLRAALGATPLAIWTNRDVPPNDGGISLGQAALAGCERTMSETGEDFHA